MQGVAAATPGLIDSERSTAVSPSRSRIWPLLLMCSKPWRGEPLTLGGEIDKLASNIALARDPAGVHFRSDSINGLAVGEAVAIDLLAEYSRTYSERFDGFVLTRFNGEKVWVANGSAQSG
jgi:hypothetical protein